MKDATVFVKVKAGPAGATGSGFLIRADGDAALVVTNHHVVTPPSRPGRRR
jgi:S1-C subfamily serine protease